MASITITVNDATVSVEDSTLSAEKYLKLVMEILSGVQNFGGGEKQCTYESKSYSHGSVIQHGDGNFYMCNDGVWTAVEK